MGLNLLYGKSQKDLMKACFEQIRHNQDQTTRNLIFVPETSKFDFESAYLSSSNESGMMRTEVLSFSRFCTKILTEIGKHNLEYIDNTGQTMVVFKILSELSEKFILYKNLAKKPGFLSQIIAVMGEMNRFLIDENMLLDASNMSTDKIFSQKTLELSILISEYKKRLKDLKLNDPSQTYSNVTKIIRDFKGMDDGGHLIWPYNKISWLKHTNIWIIGFANNRNFTLQETSLIKALNEICKITIAAYCDKDCFENEENAELKEFFSPGYRTITGLKRQLNENLPINYIKDDKNDLIKHLASCYAGNEAKKYNLDSSQKGDIGIFYAMSPREEISLVAGKIKELVANSEIRYKDISIATTNGKEYYQILRTILKEAKIPNFIDEKKSLQQTVLGRLINYLFEIISYNWSEISVISYSKCGFCDVDNEQTDYFENFVLENGLFGKEKILNSKLYENKDNKDIKEYVEIVFKSVTAFENAIEGKENAVGFTNAFIEYLENEKIYQKCEREVLDLTKKGEDEGSVLLAKAWNQLLHLLEQTKRVLGDSKIDFNSYKDIILSGMKNSYSGVIPSLLDQVNIFDINQISHKDTKVLFIVGLSEDLYPLKAPGEGLFKDKDREILSEIFQIPIPSVLSDKVNEENIIMHNHLSLPTEKIFFSCPKLETKQSVLIDFVLNSFENCEKVYYEERPSPFSLQLYSPKRAIDSYFAYLKGKQDKVWEKSIEEFKKNESLKKLIYDISNVKKKSLRKVNLNQENLDKKFGSPVVMSVSQIESYRKCAFSYYAKYLLALSQRKERMVQDTESGTILHGIAQECITKFLSEYMACKDDVQRQKLIHDYSQRDFLDYANKSIKQVAQRENLNHIFDKGTFSYKGLRACRIASSTLKSLFREINENNYLPSSVEWKFSLKRNNQLEVNNKIYGKIFLQGLIDRVDVKEDFFRVIDYKSSDRKIDFDEIYHGLSVQLLTYIAAYKNSNPQFKPADAGYFQFKRPVVNFENKTIEKINTELDKKIRQQQKINDTKLDSEQLQVAGEYVIKKIEEISDELTQGDFSVNPKKIRKANTKLPCEFCDYKSLCGFEEIDKPVLLEQLPQVIDQTKEKTNKRESFKNKINEKEIQREDY